MEQNQAENCVKALKEILHIPKTPLVSQTADIHIEQAGISHIEREMRTLEIANDYSSSYIGVKGLFCEALGKMPKIRLV